MNHPSEWTRFYHPKYGRYFYKHKGTGVVTDTLFKIGKAAKKPLMSLVKQAGKKVAEKGVEKVSNVVVKKAGDKIENVLRSRSRPRPIKKLQPVVKKTSIKPKAEPSTHHQDLMKLNKLIAQL